MRLAQQKHELDRQQLTQEKQRLEQEEKRMRKNKHWCLLNLSEIIEENWRKQQWLNKN